MVYTYNTIAAITESIFRDRGSKFIGFAMPIDNVDDLKPLINPIKTNHPKAVHCCYAYRIGIDEKIFRANDDGEPSGSAGKPILGQIDSANITNVLIVVVRYFGGTLLGVPGLINAYKTAAKDALSSATIIEKNIEKNIELEFDYSLLNEVIYSLKQFHSTILKQELTLFCTIKAGVPLKEYHACLQKLKSIYKLQIKEVAT